MAEIFFKKCLTSAVKCAAAFAAFIYKEAKAALEFGIIYHFKIQGGTFYGSSSDQVTFSTIRC